MGCREQTAGNSCRVWWVSLALSIAQCSKPISSSPRSTSSSSYPASAGRGEPLCSAHESTQNNMGQCGDSSHQNQESHLKIMSGMSAQALYTEQEYQELPFSTPAHFRFLLWEATAQHGHCAGGNVRIKRNLSPHFTLHMPRKSDIIFLGASSLSGLVQNPSGSIFFSSISCLQWFSGGREKAVQEIHTDSYLRSFRKKQIIFVQLQ